MSDPSGTKSLLSRLASSEKEVLPNLPGLSATQHIGFLLSRWMVIGIGCVILGFLIIFYVGYPTNRDVPLFALIEKESMKALPNDCAALAEQANKLLLERQKQFTQEWLEVVRTVVLMAMMPILTSLLGYTFGSQKISKD